MTTPTELDLETLKQFKANGEMYQKSWSEPATNFIKYKDYFLTYHVENFTQILVASREDKDEMDFDQFKKDCPNIFEVFGPIRLVEYRQLAKRGYCWFCQLNDFMTSPFFVTNP